MTKKTRVKSSRIYRLLKSQSVVKNNRFLKFLNSPYHNANKAVIVLAELIVSALKKNKDLTKEETIEILYNGEKIEDKKYRKLNSDLISLYQKFIIQEEFEKNKLLRNQLLLETIQENKIILLVEKAKQNALTVFDREPEKSGLFFNHMYSLNKSIYNLQTEYEKKMIKKGANRNINLDVLNSTLDQFYIIEKLRLACDLIAWQRIYKIKERPFEIEIILRMLDRGELMQNPVISAYVHIYNMLIERDADEHYELLKKELPKHLGVFPAEELREIYDSLLTYNIGRLNTNPDYHLNEALSIYDFAIENEIITENGNISPTTFRNFVVIGLRNNQFERVEEFINTKSILLHENHRENAVNFCLARLYWYKKEWTKVIQQLAIVEFKDTFYNLNAKIMLCSSYYELGEYDTLEYSLDAFYTSINRNKELSETKTIPYKGFITYTKKLVKLRDNEKKSILALIETVSEDKRTNGKTWLIEKLQEKLN